MSAWILTLSGAALCSACSALSEERAITWRIVVALILAPISAAWWWWARRAGASYTVHGVSYDMIVLVASAVIGIATGERIEWRRATGIALGFGAILMLASAPESSR